MNRIITDDSIKCFHVGTAVLLTLAAASIGRGQSPNAAGGWALEEVVTTSGKTYRGLIHAEHDGEIEFIEVVQPRGKSMYLVVRPIAENEIARKTRLPADQRKLLQQRVRAFRYRARIEAGRMENVELAARTDDDGQRYHRYRGPWFTLDSTADEESTRRSVVRIEQIFRAYRQLLPPRVKPARPLRVVLFGTIAEYADFLRKHELPEVTNPAFYTQEGNTIVAASDLALYAERLQLARERHDAIRRQYAQADEQMPEQLAELAAQLRAAGVSDEAIKAERNARLKLWQTERDRALEQLNAADRRNESAFAEVTEAMFHRLYHEGLHAYLENFVYPREEYDLPLWLHEGLAQVFQSGRLEADTLRIDAPLNEALTLVQEDLKSDMPLLMEEVISADRREFLSSPDHRRTQRLYAHAWALAYYLTFHQPVLGTPALDEYVARTAERKQPIRRFEQLVGTTIPAFEEEWLRTILTLKPSG